MYKRAGDLVLCGAVRCGAVWCGVVSVRWYALMVFGVTCLKLCADDPVKGSVTILKTSRHTAHASLIRMHCLISLSEESWQMRPSVGAWFWVQPCVKKDILIEWLRRCLRHSGWDSGSLVGKSGVRGQMCTLTSVRKSIIIHEL